MLVFRKMLRTYLMDGPWPDNFECFLFVSVTWYDAENFNSIKNLEP